MTTHFKHWNGHTVTHTDLGVEFTLPLGWSTENETNIISNPSKENEIIIHNFFYFFILTNYILVIFLKRKG